MRYALSVALMLATAAPCVAQVPNPMSITTDPGDRAVMAEVASAIAGPKPDIKRLNAVLAKLPRPTPLRGMVQTVRAQSLMNHKDHAPAVEAIEEALRLLPDDPRPKLVATFVFTYSGSPQRAADVWMLASRQSPEFARMSDRYLMMALVGRLTDIGDRARADRLKARLDKIGFSGGLARERSSGALARTREAIRIQSIGDALISVNSIANPDDLLSLYVDRTYAPLWPQITDWAGADLAAQSKRYLEELRNDWSAADNFDTAAAYANELASLDAHAAVVALFMAKVEQVQPGTDLEGVEFLAPVVARSLANLGRSIEGRVLLTKVAEAMPADYGPNALNIDASFVTLAAAQADWPEVIKRADIFLARAKDLGGGINSSATIQIQASRACALWRTGQTAKAQEASALVLIAQAIVPQGAMRMHLCRGDSVAGRSLIIASLKNENTRAWALRFVQPQPARIRTPLDRVTYPASQAVRTAPDVVVATKLSGRVLPQPVLVSIPHGFDPFKAPPMPTNVGPDTI